MTAPFNLDKALAGHTVYFRGKPVDEWHYFPQSKKFAVVINNVGTWFNETQIQTSDLELGPRIAWAVYNSQTDRLDGCLLSASREEALEFCDSTTTPVQVIIEV